MKNVYILFIILLIASFSVLLPGCAGNITDQPQMTPPNIEPAPERSSTEGSPSQKTPDISERRLKPTLPGGLEPVPTQESQPVVGEVPEKLLEEIIADLVERTGAERDSIKVVRAEGVVWNDGSLGCPKPGEFYIQVLINGYWVVLEVDGKSYDYRVNDSGYFTLCEGKGMPPFSPPGDERGKPPPEK